MIGGYSVGPILASELPRSLRGGSRKVRIEGNDIMGQVFHPARGIRSNGQAETPAHDISAARLCRSDSA